MRHDATYKAARELAARGIRVIALSEGSKLPRKGSHGANDGTTDVFMVDKWFYGTDRYLNVGISTGSIKGREDDHLRIIAIDDDSAKHGTPSLIEKFCEETGYDWPHTWQQRTGGGGIQYFFADPECKIRKGGAKDMDADGNPIYCDVRADGNFCVIAPSQLDGAGMYMWVNGHTPNDCDLAPVDDAVEAFYRYWCSIAKKGAPVKPEKASGGSGRELSWFTMPDSVGRGSRNTTMFSWLGVLVNMCLEDETIEALSDRVNAVIFNPPIDNSEMSVLLGSAGNYKKGSKAWKTNNTRANMLQYFVFKMLSKIPDNQLAYELTCIFNDLEIEDPFEAEDIARYMNTLIKQGAAISDEVIEYV